MGAGRRSTADVRRFLTKAIAEHPKDAVSRTAAEFGYSRQAIHKHVQQLVAEGVVTSAGATRKKVYGLAIVRRWSHRYALEGLAEDRVWLQDLQPRLQSLPENVLGIWHYGCTEMVNNAIDHSGGGFADIEIEQTAMSTTVRVRDDGVGIFRKVKDALGLADERHAVLELAKGKVTTDPERHTGQGIFFSSRMFDRFAILSGEVFFSHAFPAPEDWILNTSNPHEGTLVQMALANDATRTAKEVFDKFSSGEDYAFSRTVVPVHLMRYGDDQLVSRSQAKRLLGGLARFRVVVLDFAHVASVGQAFADEVFRVFTSQHPHVEMQTIHTSADVKRMISRARSAARDA